ncbi:MAG: hypothetical protein OEZ39_15945 [Gammaproteobacteria bacterium]|nr:hypothetical protein [Gammaproteobacteria bacterium]MDH5653350.1 hypothetical protein [Gammaproteobacteria bacterium]
MLENLVKLAQKITGLKPVVHVAIFGFICLLVYAILFAMPTKTNLYLIPGILGLTWCLLYLTLISAFQRLPQKPLSDDHFITKLKLSVTRGFYYLLATAFIIMSITVVSFTFRLFGIWSKDYSV